MRCEGVTEEMLLFVHYLPEVKTDERCSIHFCKLTECSCKSDSRIQRFSLKRLAGKKLI